jgi:tRNA 5-methylaminomethyl-2-thiouridine biosynthesis bifunctional protein
LLRLAGAGLETLQERIAAQRLPPDWVRALEAEEASRRAGVPLREAAWFFPGGGWVSPAGLVQSLLTGSGTDLRLGAAVESLARHDSGWTLRDSAGRPLAQAEAVVLANASDALRLLAPLGFTAPLSRRRGQVSWWPGFGASLALPLAGDGYALPHSEGLLFGATDAPHDEDPALRSADHATNVERLQRLTGIARDPGAPWDGRVGWRLQSEDRLPLAGPVPAAEGDTDQVRRWPRLEGLYLCTALGGRGITLAPLLGRLLAAQVAGAPLPVEQSLVDAVDPARWLVRARRRAPAVQG